MAIGVRRRQFVLALGGALTVWPLAARAQQPAVPVVGFMRDTSVAEVGHRATAFRQGLNEEGFTEGQNVAIRVPLG